MSGARQFAGSTISNGGESSPSNWVIRRAPSLSSAILPSAHFCQKVAGFVRRYCRKSRAVCQVKKARLPWNASLAHQKPVAIAFRHASDAVRSPPGGRSWAKVHPKFTVCRLSEWSDPVTRKQRPNPMHKILLAEDDNDMRRFLVKALENAGFEVSHHDNGMSAYQRLREEPFEMLLTDIVMPEMDGIELARRASELDPDIKIMFITGFAAVALNSDSEAPKNAKVLSKPVHLRELVSEVNKMLAA